jgi:catechol 2,3-dioxygenase-like lactoylglutathione lyase family enzyme
MLHHLSIAVSDLDRSSAFYDAVLSAMGYVRVWTQGDAIGYGVPGGDDRFAIKHRSDYVHVPGDGFHIAFAAPSRAAVKNFYNAALKQGGKDNGAPGLRPAYGEHYFAAFVIDPDGYRIEATIDD